MKNILVGVTGGIAAYKSASIVSLFQKKGYNIKVVMTKNATNIIGPLTLETLSKNRIYVDMWDTNPHYEVEHISLADWADIVLIAPATYNIVGKVANGIADDMLTTILSAVSVRKPVFFALAMNVNMYENLIFKENVDKLKTYGYRFIEAREGLLACNYIAKGRMSEPEDIVAEIERYNIFSKIENCDTILKDKKILITSGRTKENIDPIRYLSNNSSGKMGYSLAQAAVDLGAEVTLISGPTNLKIPNGLVNFIPVESALEMYEKVNEYFDDTDIFIACAAVGDYRPKEYKKEKIKKSDSDLVLKLVRNPDILADGLADRRDDDVADRAPLAPASAHDLDAEKLPGPGVVSNVQYCRQLNHKLLLPGRIRIKDRGSPHDFDQFPSLGLAQRTRLADAHLVADAAGVLLVVSHVLLRLFDTLPVERMLRKTGDPDDDRLVHLVADHDPHPDLAVRKPRLHMCLHGRPTSWPQSSPSHGSSRLRRTALWL